MNNINLEDIAIDSIDMSMRTKNCLHRAGVKNLHELLMLDEDSIRKLEKKYCSLQMRLKESRDFPLIIPSIVSPRPEKQ